MLEVISVLEVISIVQLHILVCLPNIDDSHFHKMATILQEKWILLCSGCGSGYMVVFCVFAGEALMSIQLVVDYSSSSSSTTWHQRRVVRTAAMAKKFQLVDTFEQRTPTTPPETNWKLYLVCQEETTESLVCPVLSKRRDPGSGYTTMAANLVKFDELGKLSRTVQLQRLYEGQGVEATTVAHQAKWHKTCMLQYNNTMLRRAEKRPIASSSAFGSSDDVPGKRTRSFSSEATTSDASCFFCGESGTETLHGVATYQVDTRVRKCAAQVGDNELLARLSMGDMVALEAKYHSKCLLALYYRAKTTVEAEPETDWCQESYWLNWSCISRKPT